MSIFLALACDSDGPGPAPQPTATAASGAVATTVPAASAMPGTTSTPDPRFTPAFRDFARQLNAALANRDIAFFRTRAVTMPVVCCQSSIERFDGFAVGEHRSPAGPPPPAILGGIVPVDTAMGMISRMWQEVVPNASDRYGPSAPSVYAIGTDADVSAKRGYTTALTAMIQRPVNVPGSGPLRIALVLTWVPDVNGFQLILLVNAFVQAEEWLDRAPATMGRMPVWERFQP